LLSPAHANLARLVLPPQRERVSDIAVLPALAAAAEQNDARFSVPA
jgi:hypothetical protein